jgi:hypothetical protein
MTTPRSQDPAQRARNVRLALILVSVALVFGLGFVTKVVLLGR